MQTILVRRGLSGTLPVCVAGAVLGAVLSTARATVIDSQAGVRVQVEEFIDGQAGSLVSDEDALTDDPSVLPLSATGSLRTTGLDEALIATGQGFSVFTDPDLEGSDNPAEFALEAGSYSNSESVSYRVTASAEETRTILFTTPGNPAADPEITFDASGAREVQSRVFLNGAVLVWAAQADDDLSPLSVALSVRVTRGDTGAELFATTATITGQANGDIVTSTSGPMRIDRISLDELATLDVDESSLDVLRTMENEGQLIILAIPSQDHPYTYTVTADEPLDLTASLEVRVADGPAGTGAAATLGRPFTELSDFLSQALPGVDGSSVEKAINRAVERRALDRMAVTTMPPRGLLCGATGMGMVPLLATGLMMLPMGRRSKRSVGGRSNEATIGRSPHRTGNRSDAEACCAAKMTPPASQAADANDPFKTFESG